jgi:hypothetical protein
VPLALYHVCNPLKRPKRLPPFAFKECESVEVPPARSQDQRLAKPRDPKLLFISLVRPSRSASRLGGFIAEREKGYAVLFS